MQSSRSKPRPSIRSRRLHRHRETQRCNLLLCEQRISNHCHTTKSSVRSTPVPISPETALYFQPGKHFIIWHKQQHKVVRNKWLHQQNNQQHQNTPHENQTLTTSSFESDVGSDDDGNESTRMSSRQKRPPAVFKARPENPSKQDKQIFLNNTISTKSI